MGNSWGHTLRALTEDELYGYTFDHDRGVMVLDRSKVRTCGSPRCDEPISFEGTYQYVTGRAGRLSYARRRLCVAHAEKFRAKYEPTVIPAEAHSQHASEAAAKMITEGLR